MFSKKWRFWGAERRHKCHIQPCNNINAIILYSLLEVTNCVSETADKLTSWKSGGCREVASWMHKVMPWFWNRRRPQRQTCNATKSVFPDSRHPRPPRLTGRFGAGTLELKTPRFSSATTSPTSACEGRRSLTETKPPSLHVTSYKCCTHGQRQCCIKNIVLKN